MPQLLCASSAPCSFVFEGRAPELKREELNKRSSRREDATGDLEAAKEVRRCARCASSCLRTNEERGREV